MQHLVVMLRCSMRPWDWHGCWTTSPTSAWRRWGTRRRLLMDGHSTDGTEQVAEEHGVLLVDQDDIGKGSAIRHGFGKHFAWMPMQWSCWMLTAPTHRTKCASAGSP